MLRTITVSQDTLPSPLPIDFLPQYYYNVLYYWIVWGGSEFYSGRTVELLVRTNVLYDQTIPRNAGIGRLYNQTIVQMSHAVIRGTSNSTLLALRRRF